MGPTKAILAAAALLALAGCSAEERRPSATQSRERSEAERTQDAAGRVAYGAAQQSKKAAKTAGRVIRDAAKEAREGWKEASRESRERNPR